MAGTYEANLLPLDGINIDTEWHRNQKGYLDGNGEKWYSGVFDWDRTLYNDPMATMDWLETRGYTYNLHRRKLSLVSGEVS